MVAVADVPPVFRVEQGLSRIVAIHHHCIAFREQKNAIEPNPIQRQRGHPGILFIVTSTDTCVGYSSAVPP